MFPTQGDILQQSDVTLPRFLNKIDPLSPHFMITNRGVWTSECFALCVMCDLFHIDDYIESGIYQGQSFFVMSEYLPKPCYGFDVTIQKNIKDRCSYFFDHGLIFEQDSFVGIPELLNDDLDQENSGIFIDGPKGWDALKLAQTVIDNDNVKFIGIHDSYWPVSNRDDHYEFRKHLEDNYYTWSTDDVNFVREYNYLDNARWIEYLEERGLGGILPYNKIKFLYDEDKYDSRLLKSYGPTITFIWRK